MPTLGENPPLWKKEDLKTPTLGEDFPLWEERKGRMRNKNYKGRTEKRMLTKSKTVFKAYDPIQSAYADILEKRRDDIVEIRSNVVLEDFVMGDYMTDFVCVKVNGDLMVRECVYRKLLTRPSTLKLLDGSKEYWNRMGVTDWGLIIDAETTKE